MNSWDTEEVGRRPDSERMDEPNSEGNGDRAETSEERKKHHARILLTFKEDNRLTQTTTQNFVDCVNYFASDIVSKCRKVFSDNLLQTGMEFDIADLDDDLEALQRPLAGLETPWNQAAYFKAVFNCVVNLFIILNL